MDVSVFYHDTRETYGPDGERETILANGRAVTLSVFFTGAVGLIPGVDGWAQIPVHRLRFDDDAGERISSGVGDPRFFLRVGPRLLGLPSVPVALRGGVKLAGGSFDVDSAIIPLGEGQSDVELMLEVGHSFHPRPLWTMAWVGRRWRGPNREAAREPGDEWFWFWSAGGQAGPVLWQTILEGRRGGAWNIQGVTIENRRESIVQALVYLGRELGPGEARLGLRVPIRAKNLPAGHAFTASYYTPLRLW